MAGNYHGLGIIAAMAATAVAVAVLAGTFLLAGASDPEAVTDFVVPEGMNLTEIDGGFFTFNGLRRGAGAGAGQFAVKKAFVEQFPALSGLGISGAVLEFRPKTVNPVHTHPRATELLYLTHGILHVGFVDTGNRLYVQRLEEGDLFVFPKGLVHFQINLSGHKTARAFASFSSSDPGVVSLPATLFGSHINPSILKQAFQIDDSVLSQLQYPFMV